MKIDKLISYLKSYAGKPVRIMEVCGTHTAAIAKSGIRSILSDRITLLSGPGCPVCVTADGYIDKLISMCLEGDCVLSFGDMLRVPGSRGTLSDVQAKGGRVRMIYSPFEAIDLCKSNPNQRFVLAAVGFETIAPVYALLIERCVQEKIDNLKLLCALKTMPQVLDIMCRRDIHGFLAPGHVAAICGSRAFEPHADAFNKPFCVAGFTGDDVICAVYDLVRRISNGEGGVRNLYPAVVTYEGNLKAQALISRVFEPCDGLWRGLGVVPESALRLREEYSAFDAGDVPLCDSSPTACRCGDVICGNITPDECPLFGKVCTPATPKGPCMVSHEGACGVWYNSL